jgi:hypothetical protein
MAMQRAAAFILVLGTVLSINVRTGGQDAAADPEGFFESKVRPLLAANCVECHGPTKASNALRLDSREAILKGGDSGPAIVPGDVEKSLLAIAIKHDENELIQMPPKGPLPEQAVADLRAWIAAGAKWPETAAKPIISDKPHWAFLPLQSVIPPDDLTGWAEQPIDRFIAAAQRENAVAPVRAASKHALLRRAYFDLIGLPPAPDRIESFVADERPDAFQRVIDELLASPRYGERWGRHWLDLVRYADTAGDNSDYPIPQAYLYRDYCIDALNADVPYDRFLHEQLAGDILARQAPKDDYNRLVIATGFIAQAKRIGTRELEDMHLIIEDTLATVGPVMLGLSIRCARCHDHKYEPLTQQDYYALYGIFASTQYPFAGAEEVRKQTKFAPLIHPDDLKQRKDRRDEQIARLKAEIAQLDEQQQGSSDTNEQLKTLREELSRLEKDDCLSGVTTAYAVAELTPTDVKLQKNGSPRSTGDIVPRGVPRILNSGDFTIAAGSSGRLELAHWVTDKSSHLTARVMANRIWQFHFGKPLVPTPSDFGLRGTPPTHPELLDWLAKEFIDSGWSMKAMHRRIMLSKSYQLSAESDVANMERDAGNTWYWRFDRRRLDAESLRDTTLALGGTLDLSRPGPHPFPEPSTWRFSAHRQFNQVCYPSNHRSVFLMVQRLHAHPYLSLFNGPDTSLSTPMRDTSTVPLQALFLLNNELVHNQSTGFAQSLIDQEPDPAARLQLAFMTALARPPTTTEQSRSLAFLAAYTQALQEEGCAAEKQELESWSALTRTMMRSNEFFYVE